MASQRSCVRDFFCYFGGCVVSQGRPPRLSPDISALSALTYVKEILTHGMKGRRGGAEDERKWKGTQKPQETHVGRQAHFSIQSRNPLWPSTIQKVADSQAYSKRPGSQTAHSRVRQRKLKSVIKELDAFGVTKPVLEAAEGKPLRHNTTRRSLNHSRRGEICGHLEVHNRF